MQYVFPMLNKSIILNYYLNCIITGLIVENGYGLIHYMTHDISWLTLCCPPLSRMTNCTLQLQLSEPVSACDLRHKLQGEDNGSGISATILGNVERVGG